jgi:hypothetical protein
LALIVIGIVVSPFSSLCLKMFFLAAFIGMVVHPSFVCRAPIVILAFELLVLGVISRGYMVLPFPFTRISPFAVVLTLSFIAALACTFLLVLFGLSGGF